MGLGEYCGYDRKHEREGHERFVRVLHTVLHYVFAEGAEISEADALNNA
jgi:hypothetical protein